MRGHDVKRSSDIKYISLNGCGSQDYMAITIVCTFTIACRHTRAARWKIIPSQCPALPIRPARRSTRSPHQPALAAGAKRKVESGCEVRHAPAITGFTWLVHGSHGCSTFCVGAGWRAGSYTRERQHAKRDLFHSHIAGGSQIAMEKARAGYPRICTCGIDLGCRFSLTVARSTIPSVPMPMPSSFPPYTRLACSPCTCGRCPTTSVLGTCGTTLSC